MEQTPQKTFMVEQTLLQSVVDYLGTRPAAEVYVLLNQLLSCKEISITPSEDGELNEEK